MLSRATNLEQIYQAFKGQPLTLMELETFYRNPVRARGGGDIRRRMARILRNSPSTSEHILFVGYKGCGKSTELNHLQKDIQDEFLVINFSVQTELDPVHLNYIELFIVTMERLFNLAVEQDIKISKEYIANVQNWMQSKEIEEIINKYNLSVEGEAGLDGKIGIPFLHQFFYKFKASAKSSQSLKETLKKNVEPRLSDLINHCNALIKEVEEGVRKMGRKGIVIIIEDLDKIPIDRAQELFFNSTHQLVQLQTNVIFTFHVALYYSISYNNIRAYFTKTFELPMIKVTQKNGDKDDLGINIMKEIVDARMDTPALIESEEVLVNMIRYSGGCIRDLFLMISDAADNALDNDRGQIIQDDFIHAFQRLKKDYESTIADNYSYDEPISVEDYYKTLINLYNDPNKKVDNTREVMDLRQNLCILGYNGEGWYDLHPIVREILKERGKIT